MDVNRFFANSIRRNQHYPQGFFYNLDPHHVRLSRYDKKLENDPMVLRDHVYDPQYYQSNGRGGPRRAQEFLQAGMEPLCILATTVNEMLLHSHDGKIRVFPVVDKEEEAAFVLRAQGGFMVSSEKEAGGPPTHVFIYGAAGNPCRIVSPWQTTELVVLDHGSGQAVDCAMESGILAFKTEAGRSYLLYPRGSKPASKNCAAKENKAPKQFQEAILGRLGDF